MDRKNTGWRVALAVSVILNSFFIALIGGHAWRSRMVAMEGKTPFATILARAEAELSREDAASFDAAIRGDAPHYAEAARQLRLARTSVRDQVTAERFDAQKARTALANWQMAWNNFMGAFDDTLIKALAKVSPEGRRKLVRQRRMERLAP